MVSRRRRSVFERDDRRDAMIAGRADRRVENAIDPKYTERWKIQIDWKSVYEAWLKARRAFTKKIKRKIVSWILDPEAIDTIQVGRNTVKITGDGIVFQGLTADPAMEPGKLWYRSDLDEWRYTPDGITAQTLTQTTTDTRWAGLAQLDKQYKNITTITPIAYIPEIFTELPIYHYQDAGYIANGGSIVYMSIYNTLSNTFSKLFECNLGITSVYHAAQTASGKTVTAKSYYIYVFNPSNLSNYCYNAGTTSVAYLGAYGSRQAGEIVGQSGTLVKIYSINEQTLQETLLYQDTNVSYYDGESAIGLIGQNAYYSTNYSATMAPYIYKLDLQAGTTTQYQFVNSRVTSSTIRYTFFAGSQNVLAIFYASTSSSDYNLHLFDVATGTSKLDILVGGSASASNLYFVEGDYIDLAIVRYDANGMVIVGIPK